MVQNNNNNPNNPDEHGTRPMRFAYRSTKRNANAAAGFELEGNAMQPQSPVFPPRPKRSLSVIMTDAEPEGGGEVDLMRPGIKRSMSVIMTDATQEPPHQTASIEHIPQQLKPMMEEDEMLGEPVARSERVGAPVLAPTLTPFKAPTTVEESPSEGDEKAEKRKWLKELKKTAVKVQLTASYDKNINMKDMRELILHSLIENASPTKFMTIKNPGNIGGVVLLYISELDAELTEMKIDENIFQMPNFRRIFGRMCTATTAPGDKARLYSTTQAIFQVPQIPSSKEEELMPITLDDMLLTLEDTKINDYPYRDERTNMIPDGYLDITQLPPSDQVRIYAIDCEMCLTTAGSELTRVSIVNENLNVVYDTLVKPYNKIVDYLTQYSGITEEMMTPCTVRLEHVHEFIRKNFHSNCIFAGHSLENDLISLRVHHDKIIDTAVLFDHNRGPTYKPPLRWLAEKYLNQTIQNGDAGHNSIEDAATALRLIKCKLEKGREFGGGMRPPTENIFTYLGKHGVTTAVIDLPFIADNFGKTALYRAPCTSDYEAKEHVKKAVKTCKFVWSHFVSVQNYYAALEATEPSDITLNETLVNIDNYIEEIWENLPSNTFVILLSGHVRMSETRKLIKKNIELKKKTNEWTEEMQNELLNHVATSRKGFAAFAYKQPPELAWTPDRKTKN